MSFQAFPNQELIIESTTYQISPHPAAPSMPYGQEGRKATVYLLIAGSEWRALKVFKSKYIQPSLVGLADQLADYADLPGLQVCRRVVLTPRRHPELLRQHPDLTYAALMPWIEGNTWMEIVQSREVVTSQQVLDLARRLAEILTTMEERGLAHCDLSGPNVMIALTPSPSPNAGRGDADRVALVDVEELFGPGLVEPYGAPVGSSGYAHRSAPQSLWGPNADRFAGAVMLAEMLGWANAGVRQASWGESYFDPAETQSECERCRVLSWVLEKDWGEEIAGLFDHAWQSETLADCPTLGRWLAVLPDKPPSRDLETAKTETNNESSAIEYAVQVLLDLARQLHQLGYASAALETLRKARSLANSAQRVDIDQEIKSLREALEVRAIYEANRPKESTVAPPPAVRGKAIELNQSKDEIDQGQWRVIEGAEEVNPSTPMPQGDSDRGLAVEQHQPQNLPLDRLVGSGNSHNMITVGQKSYPAIYKVIWSPDGKLIAVASSLGIYLHDARTLVEVRFITSDSWIKSIAFSPNMQMLASGSEQGNIRLWRLEDPSRWFKLEGHSSSVLSLSFSPDGQTLASASSDAMIYLWRVANRERWRTLVGHTAKVLSIAFSPDGEAIISGSRNQTIRFWRVASGMLVKTLSLKNDVITSMAISLNGQLLAVGSLNHTVCLWRLEDGVLLYSLQGHSRDICGVAFSPDGQMLAVGSLDRTISLWRISDGSLLNKLEGHTSVVTCVAFSPDGKWLASGSHDSTIRLWGIAP